MNGRYGKSLRQQAFQMYDCEASPDVVSYALGLKPETAERYYRSWRKRDRGLDARYAAIQRVRERMPHIKTDMLAFISQTYAIEPEDLKQFVETPWGWYQIMELLRRASLPSIERVEEFWVKQEMAMRESRGVTEDVTQSGPESRAP